jgi:hypothetical protein
MTERNQWTEQLRCRKCKVIGSVGLSQAKPDGRADHDEDQIVRVEIAPTEFAVVVTDLGCEFYCANCGAIAHHT